MIEDNRADVRSLISNLAASTDGLKEKLDKTVAQLDSLLTNADGMVGENRQDIREMILKFRESSASIA